jgi:hypothetical protein
MEAEGSLQCSQEPSTGLYPEPDKFSPHLYPISIRYILIISFHLSLGLPSTLFLSGYPTKILYSLLFSPVGATCLAHLIVTDLIFLIIFGEEYKL